MQRLIHCLILLAFAVPTLGYQKISMFIGIDPDSDYGFEIRAYPDIVRDFTVISTNDFVCVPKNKCVLDSTKKIMTFMNRTVTYYDAAAQLNIIKQPFANPFNFRFIANDTENIGSWIGISGNSSYLAYLYKQDQISGYRIIVRLGWDNVVTYKTGVFEGDKNLLPATFSAVQTINNGGMITKANVNFCLNNRLDMATIGLSMFALPTANASYLQSVVNNWGAQASPDQSLYNITWQLSDASGFNIGNITLNYTDLTINGTYRVKAFTPEFDNGRNCDIYTGSLMLQKYDFKWYYIEYDAGYDVRFSMIDFVLPPEKPVEVTWPKILKIILVVIVALIVALLVWFNMCGGGNFRQMFGSQPGAESGLIAPAPIITTAEYSNSPVGYSREPLLSAVPVYEMQQRQQRNETGFNQPANPFLSNNMVETPAMSNLQPQNVYSPNLKGQAFNSSPQQSNNQYYGK